MNIRLSSDKADILCSALMTAIDWAGSQPPAQRAIARVYRAIVSGYAGGNVPSVVKNTPGTMQRVRRRE